MPTCTHVVLAFVRYSLSGTYRNLNRYRFNGSIRWIAERTFCANATRICESVVGAAVVVLFAHVRLLPTPCLVTAEISHLCIIYKSTHTHTRASCDIWQTIHILSKASLREAKITNTLYFTLDSFLLLGSLLLHVHTGNLFKRRPYYMSIAKHKPKHTNSLFRCSDIINKWCACAYWTTRPAVAPFIFDVETKIHR